MSGTLLVALLRYNQHGNMLAAMCACRDAEVKEEGFLEYINQLLMTGEVAGLLPKEELDAMLNDVRPAFKRECLGALPQPLVPNLPRSYETRSTC